MIIERKDIAALLDKADPKEIESLAEILDCNIAGSVSKGEKIAGDLWWKYQTPLGYVLRTPTFDSICVDIAKKLKFKKEAENEDCWDTLNLIIQKMFVKMFNEIDVDQKRDVLKTMFTNEKDLRKLGKIDWENLNGPDALNLIAKASAFGALGLSGTYGTGVLVTSQVTRALLGRSLVIAATPAAVGIASIILGPAGWLLLLWSINDLLGTNWKRVIPAVFSISCIHERLKEQDSLPQ